MKLKSKFHMVPHYECPTYHIAKVLSQHHRMKCKVKTKNPRVRPLPNLKIHANVPIVFILLHLWSKGIPFTLFLYSMNLHLLPMLSDFGTWMHLLTTTLHETLWWNIVICWNTPRVIHMLTR
jgi:hypothetical protein